MQNKESNQTADNLIIGYLKGELNADETRELIAWIKLDGVNKRYFDEYCEIWITTRVRLKDSEYNTQEGFWKFRQKIKPGENLSAGSERPGLFKIIFRYAALVFITFSLGGLLAYYIFRNQIPESTLSFSELVVPLGSRAQFSLSDGTSVTLNAGSRLKYDNRFGIEDRVVDLEGEGYFKVAKDALRPFIVKTSHLNIRALGTEFNVKAYSAEQTIETTLVEGSVKIEQITGKTRDEVTVLKPNQKVTFYKKDLTIVDEKAGPENKAEKITQPIEGPEPVPVPSLMTEDVNVEPVISWKESRWIFEKQSLGQIAVELERRFDIQINFESERLKTFRFSGIIIAEPVEQVLQVLSISAPIDFKLKGRIVTLSENKNFKERTRHLYNQK